MTGLAEEFVELSDFEKSITWLELPVRLLNNDHSHYQRNLNESRVAALLADIDLHPPALVAKRPDATYWIVNGQHHVEAHRRAGATAYPCLVFDSAGWEEEKEIFAWFQRFQKTLQEYEAAVE